MKVRTQMFCLCAPEACRQMSASDVSAEVFCLFWTSFLGAFLAGRSRLGATEEARKGLKSLFIIIQELAMPLKSWLHRLCGFCTFSEVSWQMLSFFLEIWQNSAAHWAVGFCICVQNRATKEGLPDNIPHLTNRLRNGWEHGSITNSPQCRVSMMLNVWTVETSFFHLWVGDSHLGDPKSDLVLSPSRKKAVMAPELCERQGWNVGRASVVGGPTWAWH